MTMAGIPPYGEQDERAAREAIAQWRDRPTRSRVGSNELDDLVREVAGAIATARAEGGEAALAPFRALFAGDPDTPCRTTWRREPGHSLVGSTTAPSTECVEVPLDDLNATFDEAERAIEGQA